MTRRITSGLLFLAAFPGLACAQTALTCSATSTPPIVMGEGISERIGDIVFNCFGGPAGANVTANLTVFLSVNITNRILPTGAADVVLTVDNGLGPQTLATPGIVASPNSLVFNGLTFAVSPAGGVVLRLANVRAAANQLKLVPFSAITAYLSLNAGNLVSLLTSQLTVANVSRAFYAALSSKIVCGPRGSPLPDEITSFTAFLSANSIYNSTRLTEGYADAFSPRFAWQGLNADTGTRFLVRYGGFPSNARLFVPDVVAGSDAIKPTAASDLGLAPSGGTYAPGGKGALLLSRVSGSDSSGAGGSPVYFPGPPGSGAVSFNGISELALVNGSGFVVYEVVDANPSLQESAQFPTFLGIGAVAGTSIQTTEDLSLAPGSTVTVASNRDPVPRFQAFAPPPDCTLIGDCSAAYFPKLYVNPVGLLQFTAQAGSNFQVGYLQINNQGGGIMQWTVTASYANGAGWLRLSPSSGTDNATVRVDAIPGDLTPGIYRATLTVDAGPLGGSSSVPVQLTIIPGPAIPVERLVVLAVVNSATFQATPVAPGSIASVLGTKLGGTKVTVTFDGLSGQVLYSGDTQINVVLPQELGERPTAQVVVTVDGATSPPFTVALAPFGPGIFKNGILNQDNTLNGPGQPAGQASIIQIFATGLSGNGVISARINDRPIDRPYYAGPAPGLPGVQQVDLVLPLELSATTANVSVCGAAAAIAIVCSPPAPVYVK